MKDIFKTDMRAIKFRAWQHGKMNYEPYIYGGCSGREDFNINDCFETDLPLMQFTGLLDDQGKEIYEGDICEFSLQTPFGLTMKRAAMGWNEKIAQFGLSFESELDIPEHIISPERPKVIGNIYENPDLLPAKTS